MKPENLYVTVFSGGEGIDRDEDSNRNMEKTFRRGISPDPEYAEMNTEEDAGKRGIKSNERIFGYGVKKNWWSRAGVPQHNAGGRPGEPGFGNIL